MMSLRRVETGLHAVADLAGVDAADLVRQSAARAIEMTPLSTYFMRPHRATNAVVLGFAAVRPDAIRSATEKVAEAIDAVRRPRRRA